MVVTAGLLTEELRGWQRRVRRYEETEETSRHFCIRNGLITVLWVVSGAREVDCLFGVRNPHRTQASRSRILDASAAKASYT
jgi:hypothetical protein